MPIAGTSMDGSFGDIVMHAEITTTLAGASFVVAVAVAAGALPAKPPSSPFEAAIRAQGIHRPFAATAVPAATPAGLVAQHPGKSPAPDLRRDLSPVPSGGPRFVLDGLAAGYIISADNLVFDSKAGDSHSVTVRPADQTREFKARLLGMPKRLPEAVASQEGECSRSDAHAAVARGLMT